MAINRRVGVTALSVIAQGSPTSGAETLQEIARDPRHLGADIGFLSVTIIATQPQSADTILDVTSSRSRRRKS
jgi:hypothetical protein